MKSIQDLARLAWAFAALDLAPRELTRRMSSKKSQKTLAFTFLEVFSCRFWRFFLRGIDWVIDALFARLVFFRGNVLDGFDMFFFWKNMCLKPLKANFCMRLLVLEVRCLVNFPFFKELATDTGSEGDEIHSWKVGFWGIQTRCCIWRLTFGLVGWLNWLPFSWISHWICQTLDCHSMHSKQKLNKNWETKN